MGMVVHTSGAEATAACGRALAGLVAPGDVVLASGDLGAGKTQLTKGIASGLGVAEPVTSPTFNILLVHPGRIPLYHFDLYRLDEPEQLDDLDYWATIEGDGLSVVEWGDKFRVARPLDGLDVRISIQGDDVRRIAAEGLGPRGDALATGWKRACEGLPGVTIDDGDA